MEQKAVDVISVCNAEGEILPLRLQMIDEYGQIMRLHIQRAQKDEKIQHVGVEAVVFQCWAQLHGRQMQFRLKYTYRIHQWHLV